MRAAAPVRDLSFVWGSGCTARRRARGTLSACFLLFQRLTCCIAISEPGVGFALDPAHHCQRLLALALGGVPEELAARRRVGPARRTRATRGTGRAVESGDLQGRRSARRGLVHPGGLSGPASLTINAGFIVAFGGDDEQAAGFAVRVELNVGAAACHVDSRR